MMSVTAPDALRALNKFRQLAKQDLLMSVHTADPEFWRRQAEARRATYDTLMKIVKKEGVEAARRYALDELAILPLFDRNIADAVRRGKEQALRFFCSMLGHDRRMKGRSLKVQPTALVNSVSDGNDTDVVSLKVSS